MVSEGISSCLERCGVNTNFWVDLNTIKDALDSSKIVLDVGEFFDVLSLTIALDNSDQLCFSDLETVHATSSASSVILICHLNVLDRSN